MDHIIKKKTNKDKTEVIQMECRKEDLSINPEKQQPNQIEHFKYLGVDFNVGNNHEAEINKRMGK